MKTKFFDALKAAKLPRVGRSTRHGKATDGRAVFTIWSDDIHQIDGRFFAWWDHAGELGLHEEPAADQRARARAFVKRAHLNLGRPCRAVIVYPVNPKPAPRKVASAEFPHEKWATATFRAADPEALQFLVELTPPDEHGTNA